MSELSKFAAAQCSLRKRADALADLLADLDSRLAKIEQEDELRRSFLEAEAQAPVSATIH